MVFRASSDVGEQQKPYRRAKRDSGTSFSIFSENCQRLVRQMHKHGLESPLEPRCCVTVNTFAKGH